jgi:cell division protein FtsA
MGLDLGTTKVCAVIAEIDKGGRPTVIGVGSARCEGIKRGVVVDIAKTVSAIEGAVQEAEIMTDYAARSAYVSISGDHIRGLNSTGVVAVSRPDKEITGQDVERVLNAARNVIVPNDQLLLHVIPQGFVVDDQPGIELPVGMSGIRLEVQAHIITGAATCAQNVVKSVKMAGLDVAGLVLQPLATGFAVLTEEEMGLGVAVVDIGGGTTDISVFKEGAIRFTSVVGLGGNNVTNDLVVGLRTPFGQAEIIKTEFGCAHPRLAGDEIVDVPGVQGRKTRQVSREFVAQVMGSRLEEILYLVKGQLVKSDYYDVLGAGVVLTGGTSLVEGIEDVAEEVLSIPARMGIPDRVGGLREYVNDPRMSTGVGLLHYAGDATLKGGVTIVDRHGRLGNLIGGVRRWVSTFF